MSPVTNPFRSRFTEMQRDRSAFLRTFGVEVLEALPPADSAWNRLIVLRSAPGAGKTSILRLLTPESLTAVTADRREGSLRRLNEALQSMDVIKNDQLQILGVMVGVGKDYRALVDLGPKGAGAEKVFLKLLDTRIISKFIEASVVAVGGRYPEDASRVTFRESSIHGTRASDAAAQLFDFTGPAATELRGDHLLQILRDKENAVMRLLGSLMPVSWDDVRGHSRLHSLPFLGNVETFVDGEPLRARPVLLFDDVHELAAPQRESLWDQLLTREEGVGRWIAERRSAVPVEELFVGTHEGREYLLVDLEDQISSGKNGGRSHRLRRVMTTVANSRAVAPLLSMGRNETFTELLKRPDAVLADVGEQALQLSKHRVENLCDRHAAYKAWIPDAERRFIDLEPIEEAVRWRELEILIERSVKKASPTLFDFDDVVGPERAEQMSTSDSRGAARLFLFQEQKIPYYAGEAMLTDLSSRNIEQFLSLAGDQFDLITSAITLRRREGPYLSPTEQDSRIRRASKELWAGILRRVTAGADVQSLLYTIAQRCRAETFQANAPYAPGVTGTALYWRESVHLFEQSEPDEMTARFRDAIGTAVANNLLEMTPDKTQTKGQEFRVLYLNRLLLPHFNLPLQRGGFREETVSSLKQRWTNTMADSRRSPEGDLVELSKPEGWFA